MGGDDGVIAAVVVTVVVIMIMVTNIQVRWPWCCMWSLVSVEDRPYHK